MPGRDLIRPEVRNLTRIDRLNYKILVFAAKRDLSKSEIEGIGKQVHIKTNELNTDLDIDLSLKLFGSELAWYNINGDNAKLSPISIIDKFFDHVDQGIDKVKSFEVNFKHI